MTTSQTRKLSDSLNYPLLFLVVGVSWGVIAIADALISDGMWSVLSLDEIHEAPTELEAEVSESTNSWVFYVVELMFARPWIALGVGAVTGLVYGLWSVRQKRQRFDSDVELVCQRARGIKVRDSWRREIATWGQTGYLFLVIGISLLWPISIKTELFAFGCVMLLSLYPAHRRVYLEANRRLNDLESHGESAKEIAVWRRRQKVGTAAGTALSLLLVGWLSKIVFEMVPEMRDFAREHEQFIAEMKEKYPPRSEP